MSDATATATPPAPAPPTTPAEAASKLASLRADPAWGDRVLKSDPGALKELRDLSKQVAEGGDLDAMIVAAQDTPDTSVNGELSLRKVAGEIPSLREHLSDEVIKEMLAGRESTPTELAAVKKFQTMRHSDKSWVDRLLKGEYEAVREQRLCSIVLMQAPR
jgi:hypothetical protein